MAAEKITIKFKFWDDKSPSMLYTTKMLSVKIYRFIIVRVKHSL